MPVRSAIGSMRRSRNTLQEPHAEATHRAVRSSAHRRAGRGGEAWRPQKSATIRRTGAGAGWRVGESRHSGRPIPVGPYRSNAADYRLRRRAGPSQASIDRRALRPHPFSDIFGVGAFISQRSYKVAPLLIRRVRQLGAGWVREEFTASRLHSGTKGDYYWGDYDRVINVELRAGMRILGLLDYSNTWGYRDHGTMPHADMNRLSGDFAEYAYAVARHFRGRIRYWQVWNEPDLRTFWHPSPRPDDYARLLGAAYQAIKRANPQARIVLAGTSKDDMSFVRRVVARTRSFDVVSVHPYRDVPEANLLDEIRALRALGKPVWFSEIGWAAGPGCDMCVDEEGQAAYLVRFYTLAAAGGIARIFWYDLRDDANDPSSPEAHFGLLRPDLSGKRAFAVYAFLIRLLRSANFVSADSVGAGGIYTLRFVTRRGPVAVLWNTGASARTVVLSWHGQTATILRMDGAYSGVADVREGHAMVTVLPGGEPIFLVVRPPCPPMSPPGALLHPPPVATSRPSASQRQRQPGPGRTRRTRGRRAVRNSGAWAVPTPSPRRTLHGRRRRRHERSIPTPRPKPARPRPTATPIASPSSTATVTPTASATTALRYPVRFPLGPILKRPLTRPPER